MTTWSEKLLRKFMLLWFCPKISVAAHYTSSRVFPQNSLFKIFSQIKCHKQHSVSLPRLLPPPKNVSMWNNNQHDQSGRRNTIVANIIYSWGFVSIWHEPFSCCGVVVVLLISCLFMGEEFRSNKITSPFENIGVLPLDIPFYAYYS